MWPGKTTMNVDSRIRVQKSTYRYDKYFRWAMGGILLAFLAIDGYALARMIHAYYLDTPVVHMTEGRFHAGERYARRGNLVLLSTSSGTVEFSCADPGIAQYVGCMQMMPSLEGKAARIEWIHSPVNAISGTARRPVKIEIAGLGTVLHRDTSLAQALKSWTLKKAGDVGIAALCYLAAFPVTKKLLSVRSRRKA